MEEKLNFWIVGGDPRQQALAGDPFESIHLIDLQPVTCMSLQVIENFHGRSSILPSSL